MLYYFMDNARGAAGKRTLYHHEHRKHWHDGLFQKKIIHLLLIGITGLLIYSNTFQGPFQWDEADYIVRNPIIRDLGYFVKTSDAEGFPVYNGLITRYVGYLTFAINYRIHEFDVTGYHIVNLIIHLANSILLYYFIILSFKTPFFALGNLKTGDEEPADYSRFVALCASLLFVAHPIQTEAVTYVFQRFTSLVSLFFLLSLVLYVKGRLLAHRAGIRAQSGKDGDKQPALHTPGPALFYLLSLVSVILAMKTKENAFTLPFIIVICEFLFFRGSLKGRVLRLVPFLVTLLIIPATFIGLVGSAGELISPVDDPLSLGYHDLSSREYLYTQFRVIVTYVRLLFLPTGQNLIHDAPAYRSLLEPAVIASFSFLFLIFSTAGYLTYRSRVGEATADSNERHFMRMIAFGIFWFFITLSVESGIIPISMVMDEYRVYLPSAGLFLAMVSFLFIITRRLPGSGAGKERTACALFVVIILSLGYATYTRNSLWLDKVDLWADVVRKNPTSERGRINLGTAYYEKGLYDRAIEQFSEVVSINPAYSVAYVNLGAAYATIGRADLAVRYFKTAVELDPSNSLAHANLGRAYRDAGMYEEAVMSYSQAVTLDPFHTTSYFGLGSSLSSLGRFEEAAAVYSRLIRIIPNDAEVYRNRGMAYSDIGDVSKAREDFQRSCALGSVVSCGYVKSSRFR